jgi:hypothetical protein
MDKKLTALCEKSESEGRKPLLFKDHAAPVSRRQFMAAGLAGSAHVLMVPSFAGVLGMLASKRAWAECAPIGGNPNVVPTLIIDCAGGPGLSANAVMRDRSYGLLSSYNRLGVMNPSASNVADEMGLGFWRDASRLYQGVRGAGNTALDMTRVRAGAFCFVNNDDTTSNVINMTHYINQFTGGGQIFKGGVAQSRGGFQDPMSGGNSRAIAPLGEYKPAVIQNLTGIQDAVGIGASNDASQPWRGLSQAQQAALTSRIRNLSNTQLGRIYNAATSGAQLKEMMRCGLEDLARWTADSSLTNQVDPRNDADAAAVYNLADTGSSQFLEAAMLTSMLRGFSSTAVKIVGGCDYHDGTRTTGDAKDLEIGQIINRALRLFVRKGRPLVIHVIADGSVFSPEGSAIWQGDAGASNISMMFALGRTQAPASALGGRWQVGHFNGTAGGQGAARDTYIGNDMQKATIAAFFNYAHFVEGQAGLERAKQIVGRSLFDENLVTQHLMFGQVA